MSHAQAPDSEKALAPQGASISSSPSRYGVPGLVHNIWGQHDQGPKFPPLAEDIEADVCIIGAGITGLSIAYNLADSGKRIVVLEARVRGGGMSGRSHGMMMKWNDDWYGSLIEEYGLPHIKKLAEAHSEAIDWVENVVKKENINCGFARVDGYLAPHDDSPAALFAIASEWQAGLKLGIVDIEKTQVELSGRAKDGGMREVLKFVDNAELDPVAYVNGLADCAVARGVRIYETSRALTTMAQKVDVHTGYQVRAPIVIHASGTPLNQNLAIHSRQRPYRHYMMTFSLPTTGLINRAQYYDTMRNARGKPGGPDAFHFARFCPQPDGPEVLLVGGCHHPLGQTAGKMKDHYAELEQWARAHFSMVKQVLHKWSVQTYEPTDRLPLIGHDPLNPHDGYFVATGDSGQHVTNNTLAGLLISDVIKGKISPYKGLFDTARALPLHDWRETLTELTYFGTIARKYVARFLPRNLAEVKGMLMGDIEDLAPGQGLVCQKGLHKVAVYKDETGVQHEHSAVCTHMGCLINWNPLDKSFDCACHGSVYDCYGNSISGPSRCSLKPAEGFWLV